MPDFSIRPAEKRDIAAITGIYAHSVRHGTASFEIEPPDQAEMAQRRDAVLAGGYPFLWPRVTVRSWATPIAGLIVCGRAIDGPSRIRSTSRRRCRSRAPAVRC